VDRHRRAPLIAVDLQMIRVGSASPVLERERARSCFGSVPRFALGGARLLDFDQHLLTVASSQAFLQDNSGEYMEQRRLRLGDILDDYCPRERRVTNHAVVAMVEEDVKQTRCSTCDAEHVYKGGKAPRRRKAETPGKLYKQVLAGLTDDPTAHLSSSLPHELEDPEDAADPASVDETLDAEPDHEGAPIEVVADVIEHAPSPSDAEEIPGDMEDEPQPVFPDDGPVHRPLIRAQLPRVEGVKPERQLPDFTMRQAAGRSNGNPRNQAGQHTGNRFGRGPQRGPGGRGGSQGFGRAGQSQRNRRGR
jgi:hypothetical protein